MPLQAAFCASCGATMQQESTNPELQPGDTGIAEAPGKNFLLIAGISYVLLSASSLIYLMWELSRIEWGGVLAFGAEAFRNILTFFIIFTLYVCFILFVGVMGIVNRTNLKRVKLLQWIVIGEIGAHFLVNLISFMVWSTWTHWLRGLLHNIGLPVVLVFPINIALFIVFIIGVRRNIEKSKVE